MKIKVNITEDELLVLELDQPALECYIIDTLDDNGDLCLPAYDVDVVVTDD